MNTKKLQRIHEALGDDYLDTMRKSGIDSPPPVAWLTGPDGHTFALIVWDDGQEIEEVGDFPRDQLVRVVALRVMGRVRVVAGRN